MLAHLGVAIFTAGAVAMSVWAKDDIGRLKLGESLQVANYEFTLNKVIPGQRENFQFLAADISVTHKRKPIKMLRTEQRFYPVREMITTEAGFHYSPTNTLFAAISEGDASQGWIVRANIHPFVTWIWLGAFLMALAGFISLADKRLRFEMTESSS